MRRTYRLWAVSLLIWCALLGVIALPGCGKSGLVGSASGSSAQETAEARQGAPRLSSGQSDARANASSQSEKSATSESVAVPDAGATNVTDAQKQEPALDEGGTYTSKDEVAWYLHTYGHLPSNYITKSEAEDAGWKTGGKSLAQACPGKSIGGDRFGNREGKLPKAKGRTWYECDIDYAGERSRNAKRILYSNDGLIYYTEDHYQTFERLY